MSRAMIEDPFIGATDEELNNTLLYGRPVMEYTKRQLAAFVVHQTRVMEKQRERHAHELDVMAGVG